MQGRVKEAKETMARLLAIRNDVGLLAEEYSVREARQLGNYPQAFTHIGLVNTAGNILAAEGKVKTMRRTGRNGAAALRRKNEGGTPTRSINGKRATKQRQRLAA
jgi:hypothetical protein